MLLVLLDVMYLLHHVYEGSISHSHSTPQKPWWMQGIKHTSLGAKIQGVFNVNGGSDYCNSARYVGRESCETSPYE